MKKKIPSGTTTRYIFSGIKVIAEYTGATPALSKEYVYAGSQLLVTLTSSGVPTYHHPDHLSVRVNTDSAGAKIGEQGHYPFGESWYSINATTKWQFTSYERDSESGLDYAMFRYDSSRLGRFMTPDPLPGTIFDPQSFNRYAYVLNDPVNLADPLGLLTCTLDGLWIPCELVLPLIDSGAAYYAPPQGSGWTKAKFGNCWADGNREWCPEDSDVPPWAPPDSGGPLRLVSRCIPRERVNRAGHALLNALSFWAAKSGVTYFAGLAGSKTWTSTSVKGGGVGGSGGISVLYTADPQGKQAIVLSGIVQGAVGTPGASFGVEIGAATYQSVHGFEGPATGGMAVGGARLLNIGGSYTSNSSGTATSAFVGVGTRGVAAGPIGSAGLLVLEICPE